MFRQINNYFLVIMTLSLLSGCGGGNVGIDGSGSRTDEIHGPINGFGSVIINGVRYKTDKAEIIIEGEKSSEDELRVGDYVTIVGSVDDSGSTGTATTLYYQPNVVGAISAIDMENDSFVVLDSRVVVSNDTSFDRSIDSRSLAGLSVGMSVIVSGAADGDGNIYATRVQLKGDRKNSLTGVVRNLNTDDSSFLIRKLKIDYSQALVRDRLANGLVVIASGLVRQEGILKAESVRAIVEKDTNKTNRKIDITGEIWAYDNADRFRLLNFDVILNDNVEFKNGSKSDLKNGVRIKLSGSFQDRQTIIVKTVEFIRASGSKITGKINNIDIIENEQNMHLNRGEITINRIKVIVGGRTRIEDARPANNSRATISDLRIGDDVIAYGRVTDDNFYAQRLEIDRDIVGESKPIELQGKASEIFVDERAFELLGYRVELRENTQIFSGRDMLTTEQFLSQLDSIAITLQGSLSRTGVIEARRIRFVRSKR